MTKRTLGAVAIVVGILVGAIVWWRAHGRDSATPATPAAADYGSGSAATHAASATPTPEIAHVKITVTDSLDHAPIAGAAVRLRPRGGGGDVIALRTSSDGTAYSTELAAGDWAISASAEGHVPGAAPLLALHAGDDARVAIALAPGGRSLSGTITDTTGGPVAGARIDAAALDARAKPADAVASTTSGADGKYRMTVAEGHLVVGVSDPDYAPVARFVAVGATGAVADFALVPGGALEGVVRDEQTHVVVAGASIEARRETASVALAEAGATRSAIAGADGRFRIAGLSPGSYELRAQADNRVTRTPTVLGLGVAEQRSGVELLIRAGPVVRGVVVDEAGAPVGDAHVLASGPGDQQSADADAHGTFAIVGLHAGRYRVSASSREHLPAGNIEIELTTHDVDNVRVVVKRGAEVHGHVEPRGVATVTLGGDDRGAPSIRQLAPITTGEDGTFSFRPVSDGPARLDASTPSGASGRAVITVGKDLGEVVIQLAPGGSIAGRVVDGSGKPIGAVTVIASSTADNQTTIVNGMVTSGVQAITAATGDYELRGLTAGGYVLRVVDRGHPLAPHDPAAARLTLAEAERKTGVELAVERPIGTIQGTVLGADGTPLADAWVSVHQDLVDILAGLGDHPGGGSGPSDNSWTSVTSDDDDDSGTSGAGATPPALTDASGHFEIGGLVRGKYQVLAEGLGGRVRGRASDVVPDATITINATAPTEIAGTVHGAGGPATVFSIELAGPSAATQSFADPNGQFSFPRVDPGTYTLHVTSADGEGDATTQVVVGQVANVDITLTANAIVIGTLVDAAGIPQVGIAVAVVPDSHDGHLSITLSGMPPASGPDGSFRVEGKPGDSVFVAMVRPSPTTQRGLDLVAGQTLDLGKVVITPTPPAPPVAPVP